MPGAFLLKTIWATSLALPPAKRTQMEWGGIPRLSVSSESFSSTSQAVTPVTESTPCLIASSVPREGAAAAARRRFRQEASVSASVPGRK